LTLAAAATRTHGRGAQTIVTLSAQAAVEPLGLAQHPVLVVRQQ